MSNENVEIVRAFYEQLARGDFSALRTFSDELEFVTSPELPDAGTYRGEAAPRARSGTGSRRTDDLGDVAGEGRDRPSLTGYRRLGGPRAGAGPG
jgi:ketosteroid isomerase-like protein